jgi:putative ABC transport system permease protein
MLQHYLSVAFRNLERNKLHTTINILGLAIGLACFVGAYVFVDYTSSFETQFKNSDRIYTIYNGMRFGDNDYPPFPYVSVLVAEYIKANFPEIDGIARTQAPFKGLVSVDGRSSYRKVKKVDPDFFEMFDMPIVRGDSADPLGRPGSAVITAKAAEALFGTQDVLGRSLTVENKYDLAISAVVEDVRGPSHLGTSFLESSDGAFDVMVRYDFNPNAPTLEDFSLNQPGFWFNQSALTHVLLPADGSLTAEDFTARLQALVDNNLSKDTGTVMFQMRPVGKFVMWTANQMVFGGRSAMSITGVLLLLGGLVLITAAVNFINLATAQAGARAKEVGMRKVLGAKRAQIARQYLAEVFITVSLALLLASAVISAAIPAVNRALHALISVPGMTDWRFWAIFGTTIGIVVLGGGLYPAVILARARPAGALHAASIHSGPRALRTGLVSIQFMIASLLLVVVLVMHGQNQSLRRSGLGLADDPYLVITSDLDDADVDLEVLGDALRTRPGIAGFTGTRMAPWSMGGGGGYPYGRSAEESAARILIEDRFVAYDYFATLGMDVLAGRAFSRDFASDLWPQDEDRRRMATLPEVDTVIDSAAAKALGWPDPEDAVGQLIYKRNLDEPAQPVRVVGVVETVPLRVITWGAPQAGIAYYLNPKMAIWPIVRASKSDVSGALAQVDATWAQLSPSYPIERHFMDEDFDRAVGMFESINRLFVGLSAFAVLIADMGLFGMATYLTGRRKLEIGVRKSMGAKTRQIMQLLVWDFSKPVLIANILAWPLAFLAASAYLRLFVDRIALTPMPFLWSLAMTMVVAWFAVASQVFLAGRLAPAHVLRQE